MNRLTFIIILLSFLFLAGTTAYAQSKNCVNAPTPRLIAGQQGKVTPGLPNNFRSGAGIWNRRIGQIPTGGVFDVLDGPLCAGGYYWWQIAYRGRVGWTAEGVVGDYWLSPLNNRSTTSQETLSLRVDPFIQSDGGFIELNPSSMVTVMLSSTPEDADRVEFYLSSTGTSSVPSLIGTDNNLTNGAAIQWRVGDSLLGYLSASVLNTNGEIIAVGEELGVVAGGSGTIPDSSQSFVHSTLGFKLKFPAQWAAEETATGVVLSKSTLRLLITTTPPSGLPAGDRITISAITLVSGIDVRRDHTIYQDRAKSVIYNHQGLDQIPLGDLELFILLTDTNPNYDTIDLTELTIAEVDQIVATLSSI